MALTKIRGSQVKDLTLKNLQIATDAAIETTKLAEGLEFIKRDGSVAFTGNVDLNNHKIVNLAPGLNPKDAVNMAQLQAFVSASSTGLDVKKSCRVATEPTGGNIDLVTGGLLMIDNIQLVAGDRVLVKNQDNAAENGIYVAAAGEWLRSDDADNVKLASDGVTQSAAIEIKPGTYTFIEEGTTNADSGWIVVTDGVINLGTSPIEWTKFTGLGQVVDGDGLIKTGNRLDVRVKDGVKIDNDFITVNIDGTTLTQSVAGLKVKASGITEVELNSSVAGTGLSGGDGQPLSVNIGDGLTIGGGDTIQLKLADDTLVVGVSGVKLAPLAEGKILIGSATAQARQQTLGGDVRSLAADGTLTLVKDFFKLDRLAIGEVPNEVADGSRLIFTFNDKAEVGTLAAYMNGIRLAEGLGNDFTVDYTTTPVRIQFEDAPRAGDTIEVDYIKFLA